ncbi:craniofacial development protein 2-like [Clytia hemisphaerica]|uniref:craniofacial development protein 2-like n=1 Tax=Clytia hemisphaerica TaxID=252671 RepID=UPI0034D57766
MSQNSTRVEAPELSRSILMSDRVQRTRNEVDIQNPFGRVKTDVRKRKGLLKQTSYVFIGQLNCRTLNSLSAKKELSIMALKYNISICAVQEHRIMHSAGDPPIYTNTIGPYTLFTASAWKSSVNATIGGVGILVKSSLLSLIQSIDKISDRIVSITFKGNPKTTIISCYSPHSGHSDLEVEQFFEPLTNHLISIPRHSFVSVCGDFNAHLKGAFSYHSENNRNGSYLQDFMNECNLLASNTCFQKRKTSLWTWKSPSNQLSQIDYILCRKRWRNSIHDCQAHSSSDPVGSDHRISSLANAN